MDMEIDSVPWTKLKNETFCIHYTTRQHQCIQTQAVSTRQTNTQKQRHSTRMAASASHNNHSIIPIFVSFLLVSAASLSPALSLPVMSESGNRRLQANQTFRPGREMHRLKRVNAYLKKINKPAVKTIQSPDGDVIDCVLSHLQPAFDHPELKGANPLDPPERPRGNGTTEEMNHTYQLWAESGESCPEGTVPIRRTTAKDVLRASSIRRFGRKLRRHVRRDTSGSGHEVSPDLYGDNYPRFFTYWTSDAYQATGCYNLLCSGFVQTNNKIAIGAAISPRSSYNGRQFDIGIMVWKDPKHGHWWLEFGSGLLVGYWPSYLFSHLRGHASMVQFGGEIVNSRSRGYHTSTQMGSGHFAGEGFGKAAYFRNLQVVDWDNNLLPLTNLHLLADHSNCYDIRQGRNNVWGTYFYYGGPGRNVNCV
ncbi:hypothetical protein Tsubulata_002934 [Turnera subulata]|uniref:Neprosin PEP catalytic domain-containing protein n=1 Tax=Turnera subulata TaxID=218843 RepID=A0A9Q0G1C9_9ROSI|nr:hypothetical protein Tsubulata_002934 [Turnera subulata]